MSIVQRPDGTWEYQPPQFQFPQFQNPGNPGYVQQQEPEPEVIIGWDIPNGDHVELTADDLVRHLAVFGKSGTGKSTFLRNLFNEQINNELIGGGGYRGCAVIDPHGNLIDELCEDVHDQLLDATILLDLTDRDYTFGINLFAGGTDMSPAEKTKRVNQITAIFKKVAGANWGALLENWLPIISHTFLDAGEGTLVDIPRLLDNKLYRDRLLKKCQNNYVRAYWERHTDKNGMVPNDEVDSSLRRFGTFLMNPLLEQIFGQTETTIPFQQIVDENLTLLVKLPNDDEATTSLIATVIFQELFNATVNRTATDPYLIIVDECQLVTTPDLARFIDEARKRNVGICLATQRPGKVGDDRVQHAMMNVGTLVTLTLDYDDAYPIGKRFAALEAPEEQYIEVPQPATTITEVRRQGHPNPYVVSLVKEIEALYENHQYFCEYLDNVQHYYVTGEFHPVYGEQEFLKQEPRYHPERHARAHSLFNTLWPLLQNAPTTERAGVYKPPPAYQQLMDLQADHGWGTAALRMSDDVFLMHIASYEPVEAWGGAALFREKAIEYGNILSREEIAAEIRQRLEPSDEEPPPFDEPPSSPNPVPKTPKPTKPLYDMPIPRRARKAIED